VSEPQKGKRRRRSRRHALRGKFLVEAAVKELGDIVSWQNGPRLTWNNLAARLGVSRQAVATKELLKQPFEHAKKEIRKNYSSAKAIVRRDSDARITVLKQQVADLEARLGLYLEKWAEIERNCQAHNIDPRLVFGEQIVPAPNANGG
jgi:uncharacterized protein YceH (UPF0502 family)